jgi:Pretoxin HINT domain
MPDATASGETVQHAFGANGTYKVAARFTTSTGQTDLAWTTVTVHHLPPDVAGPTNLTVTAGETQQLSVTVTPDGVTVDPSNVKWWLSFDNEEYGQLPNTGSTISYDFESYGDYYFWVEATDVDGEYGETSFTITANNDVPAGQTYYVAPSGENNGQLQEGNDATIRIQQLSREFDPENIDGLSVYVSTTGSAGPYEKIDEGAFDDYEWGYNRQTDTLSFLFNFDDGNAGGICNTVIWIEDDWGANASFSLPVHVANVAPTGTLNAGLHIATMASSRQEVWGLRPGASMQFLDPTDPSRADSAKLQYLWLVNGAEQNSIGPACKLPDNMYVPGNTYTVEASIKDKDGGQSPVQEFTLVVLPNVDSLGLRLAWNDDHTDYIVVPGEDDLSSPLGYSPSFNTVYGEFLPVGETAPANYDRFAVLPVIKKSLTEPTVVHFELDDASEALANEPGTSVRYLFSWDVYDVGKNLQGEQRHNLIGHDKSFRPEPDFGVGIPPDRMISINVIAQINRNGQILTESAPYQIIFNTPVTPTTWEQASTLVQGLRDLLQQFAGQAELFIDKFRNNSGLILSNLKTAFNGALKQFIDNWEENLGQALFEWLGVNPAITFDPSNLLTGNGFKAFLLSYSGFTWDNLQNIILQELGAGNVATVTKLVDELYPPDADGNPQFLDVNSPTSIITALNRLGADINWDTIVHDGQEAMKDQIGKAAARAAIKLAAKFIPGIGNIVGLIQTVTDGIQFLSENHDKIQKVLDRLGEAIAVLDDAGALQGKIYLGLQQARGLILEFAGRALGMDRLRDDLKAAFRFVPDELDKYLRIAIRKFATGLGGGTGLSKEDARLLPPNARESVTVDGVAYSVFVVGDSQKAKVKAFKDSKLIKTLEVRDFVAGPAQTHFSNYLTAANRFRTDAKAPPKPAKNQPPTAQNDRLTKLKDEQKAVAAARDLVATDIEQGLCNALNAGCFAAGTKLWTPSGYRAVESIQPGELVFSRDQYRPDGLIEAKPVEKVFIRLAEVLHVHVGGQVMRTTAEHPFYAYGKGWTAASELTSEDRILTATGDWKPVEEVFPTGELETVYNVRVAEHHTYFVGEEDWGWAAWAHNVYTLTPRTPAHFKNLETDHDKVVGEKLYVQETTLGYAAYWFKPKSVRDKQVVDEACWDRRSKIGNTLQAEVTVYAADWRALPVSSQEKYTQNQRDAIELKLNEINSLRTQYNLPIVSLNDFLAGASIGQLPSSAAQADKDRYGVLLRSINSQRASAQGIYVHKKVEQYCLAHGYTYSNVGIDILVTAAGKPDLRYEVLRDTVGCWTNHYRDNMVTNDWRALTFT